MPLVDSTDPAAGDDRDYNRTPRDGKHRSHRFIASNQLVPGLLKLPGWQEQVRAHRAVAPGAHVDVPEIADEVGEGPIVTMALDLRPGVAPGADTIPLRVVMTFEQGRPRLPHRAARHHPELGGNARHRRAGPGRLYVRQARRPPLPRSRAPFLFKAEPVDQYGNLIDRHNLWEMVGVRLPPLAVPGLLGHVRVQREVRLPALHQAALDQAANTGREHQGDHRDFVVPATKPGRYRVEAVLNYRKVDQFLLNYLLGEKPGQTAPVVRSHTQDGMARRRAGDGRQSAFGTPRRHRGDERQ